MNPVAAVILAGGQARRMQGRDKGLIELDGKPMVQWALERLSAQVGQVIINANRNADAYGEFGVPVLADALPGHLGPLAGLHTALDFFDQSHVFMCPCDSPFLPDVMVSRMLTTLQSKNAQIAVATDAHRQQPVFLLVHRNCRDSLDEFLVAGERKIDRWFEREVTVEVSFADYPDAFRNINTEEERLAVEVELSGSLQ